jgi:hypothetical protein
MPPPAVADWALAQATGAAELAPAVELPPAGAALEGVVDDLLLLQAASAILAAAATLTAITHLRRTGLAPFTGPIRAGARRASG